MEPLDYLKILQRHWKVALGLVVVVVVVVFLLTPSTPSKEYEATATLLRDSASGVESASSADNPLVVELWATQGEVPARVAEALGHTGPVDDLIHQLEVVASPELGTVRLTAIASSPEEAVLLVNAFAEQTLTLIDEREAARIAEERAEGDERAAEIQTQIDELQARIAANGGAQNPGNAGLIQQQDALYAELAAAEVGEAPATTKWVTLQKATSADEAEGSAIGVTRGRAVVLSIIVALLLSLGVAIMLDRSDSRLHTKDEVERQFGLPVLAEVPLLPLRLRHRAAVAGYEQDHRVAEAYRSLRTALLLFRDRLPLGVETAELSGRSPARGEPGGATARQVVVVTSPEAGDGKSSSSANLAMAYAEAGQSVLLIQWDLWRPLPARTFGADEEPGVSEYLAAGNASLVQFVQQTSVPGLHLVPAGALGHQPGAHLDTELRLLEEARSMADVVIIDTAPLLAASVTRELVTMADVVVVASRVGRTTSPAAGRTAELLERLGAPVLGVVLVGVPAGLFNDYYGTPKSRTERLRASVTGLSGGERELQQQPVGWTDRRYRQPRLEESGPGDPFTSSDTVPGHGTGP